MECGFLIQITPQVRILVAVEAIDGRKGIDSLAQLCREKLNADPFSGSVFIFRSRRGTAIMILAYDGQGFWLATKRLSKGRFRWWHDRRRAGTKAASPSGTTVAGRRQPGDRSSPSLAATTRLKKSEQKAYVPFWTLPHWQQMSCEMRYRGRVITPEDIALIRQLIADNPHASRRRLSAQLCEVWQWKQANGALRDMVCRGLLLQLHRAGEIELPPVRFRTLNPFVRRAAPAPMLIDTTPITGNLRELRPIDLGEVK